MIKRKKNTSWGKPKRKREKKKDTDKAIKREKLHFLGIKQRILREREREREREEIFQANFSNTCPYNIENFKNQEEIQITKI